MASELGAPHPGIGGEIDPAHRRETLAFLPVPCLPLLTEWVCPLGRGTCPDHCKNEVAYKLARDVEPTEAGI